MSNSLKEGDFKDRLYLFYKLQMKQYLSLVQEILETGERRSDRTGTGTISVFGIQRKYDLRKGFPLMTTKRVNFSSVLRELLWFLRGSTNINDDLTEYTKIWDPWADSDGELGPIYGYQWRKWKNYQGGHIDQIKNVIDLIKNDPASRRIIVSAWNVADLPDMRLPPCHLLFQFYVINNRLDCQLYQRSADIALGVPYNIASYSCLMHMVAQECDLQPGIFTHTIGDAHIYLNHVKGLKEQLKRETHPLCQLKIVKKSFADLKFEDFEIENYEHEPFIKFEVAV